MRCHATGAVPLFVDITKRNRMALSLLFRTSRVLSRFPANRTQGAIGKFDRLLVGHRSDCVVPAVQKAAYGDHGQQLDDLVVRVMLAQFDVIFRFNDIWRNAGRERQIECRPFGIGKERRCLVAPERLNSSGTPSEWR